MALLNETRDFIDAGVDDLPSKHVVYEALEALVLTLAPFAPHTAEELHEALGRSESVFTRPWPKADAAAMELDEIEIPVQVNGKLRGTILLPREANKEEMERLAMNNDNVKKFVDGKQIQKLIAVPGRIVNIVAK
jgi:leucyl-tRNA synthetase